MSSHALRSRAGSDVIARRLKEAGQALDSITTREDLAGLLNATGNAQKLNDLVEDLRDALMGYQVCTPEPLAPLIISNNALDLVTARYL